ncbi:MAG: hypoxanthine phosphoribosyltransferase [Candidatus Hydrogenedentes bacterium]|nr:hypoxanthine phosphoribosyltransferase [Candidatus Hydrogenedentota bacterium]
MRLSEHPLIGAETIQARVRELGAQITTDYAGRELMVIVVLKGGLLFAADLLRAIRVPLSLEYIRAKSYDGDHSQGHVELRVLPEQPLRGKHVLFVEDILDTGRTTAAIMDTAKDSGAASIQLCVLLDKPSHRTTPVHADYVGFTIDDHFVVGYGLDFDEHHRELPAIHVMENSFK